MAKTIQSVRKNAWSLAVHVMQRGRFDILVVCSGHMQRIGAEQRVEVRPRTPPRAARVEPSPV